MSNKRTGSTTETTSRNYDVKRWFGVGVATQATYLLVVRDPSGNPYPRFVKAYEDVREVAETFGYPDPRNGQQVLEIFKLSMPLQPQLNSGKAMFF